MSELTEATRGRCGDLVEIHPPNLPPSGGAGSFRDDPEKRWQVLDYVCGDCWANRPRTWSCLHCGGTGPTDGNFCSRCHHVRPDPLPCGLDTDLLAKEEAEQAWELADLLCEAIREFPGFPWTARSNRSL